MLSFGRHAVAAGAVALALAGTVAAFAGAFNNRRPVSVHSWPGQTGALPIRTYPFCPGRARHLIRSTMAGARVTLVPVGARQALLCRYTGAYGGPTVDLKNGFGLIARRLVSDRATVSNLASEFNALTAPHRSVACPNDTGAAIIAFFRYSSESDDPVTVALGGCMIVTNGHLTRTAAVSGFKLVRQLEYLTSARHSEPYRLYTHCGIEWAWIHGTFWRAHKPLSDGHGNPPVGWGNPSQDGTLTFTSATTAVFKSAAGSVTFHRTARPRPSYICS